ncbi:MAG TPA: diguanylate cyclase [Xanthomonadales bacterium]|nr:diguanylate cyclase [Xanthomonadales bacterium]
MLRARRQSHRIIVNVLNLHAPEAPSPDSLASLITTDEVRSRFELAMGRARSHAAMLSVLCIDLGEFKQAPASAGEDDDELLHKIAEHLRRCARRNDLVARLNGDICLIVAEFMDGPFAAHRLADRLLLALQQPFPVGSRAPVRGASIGIATASGVQLEAEHPLRRAHRAMLRAKLEGGSRRVVADVAA